MIVKFEFDIVEENNPESKGSFELSALTHPRPSVGSILEHDGVKYRVGYWVGGGYPAMAVGPNGRLPSQNTESFLVKRIEP